MSQISGKIWGATQLIFANGAVELHRISVNAGMKCSMHKHEYKFNGFFVETGKLIIRVEKNDYDLVDETILGPGDFTTVKPNEYHQFESIEDTVAYELYYAHFDHNDIVRKDHGGPINSPSPLASVS
jgi:mannose-6-phosphate isomerase-like protein (cupin superfamily)